MDVIALENRYQDELKKFGQNIRKIREILEFGSQEDFGKSCGINRTQISRIESALVNIEFETTVRLAAGCQLQLIALFEYSDSQELLSFDENIGLAERIKIEKKKFGARLLQIREHRGNTQLEIEVATGIGRSKVSEYENGIKNISFRTLVKFMLALEVEMADFFDNDDSLPE